jgi:spermidine synthase
VQFVRASRYFRLLLVLGSALLVFELIALTGIARAPYTLVRLADAEPFIGAAFAGVFLIHAALRPRLVEIGATVLVAAALALHGLSASAALDLRTAIGIAGTGLGVASLGVLAAIAALRANEREAITGIVMPALSLVLLAVLLTAGLDLTVALHPAPLDAAAARLDDVLLGPLAGAAVAYPSLREPALVVYHLAPLAVAAAYAHERRARSQPRVVHAAALAGAAGLVLAQAAPIVGPLHGVGVAARSERFGSPPFALVTAVLVLWGLPIRTPARRLAAVWFLASALAALSLGEAHAIDLVLALAVVLAVDAIRARDLPWSRPERRIALPAAGAAALAWILLLRNASAWLGDHWLASTVLFVPTGAGVALLHRRLGNAHARAPDPEIPSEAPPQPARLAGAIAPIFFCSGLAGLVYEVVFGKHLALTFGNTAQAGATVLATYMGGMALGSWAGGRLGARRGDALRVYAFCEIGVGAWCALSPLTFSLVRAAYVALAAGLPADHGALPVLQFVLGGAAMLPATFLMGVTMPVLARGLLAEDAGLGRAVGLLYGANTFGAAAGALLAGYAMLPAFGIRRSTWIAVGLNLVAAALGLRLARRGAAHIVGAPTVSPGDDGAAPVAASARRERRIALAILLGGGAVTLALEVAYTHLLAVVAGNSVYAFSLMLFSFLVGLGLGAWLMRTAMRRAEVGLAVVGAVEIGLAAAILAGVFVWEMIPGYFASFAARPEPLGFGARELVRFAVCCVAMVPPAVFIGALYPAAMEIASRAHPRGPVVGVGRAAALNTAGNIAGAVAASFVVLPRLGSLATLHAVAGFAALLGLLVLLAPAGRRALVPAAAAVAVLLALAQPRSFDLARLATGANVYFMGIERGRVIDHAESVSGGLTTVMEGREADGTVVRTLLTNGKFQGDDSPHRQVKAQFGFCLAPLLHTTARDRALVVGFGVGGTARAARDAGFARTDVAELSGDILRLADRHYRALNGAVLDDPSVHTYVTDGRNFLLLQPNDYDLIAIEVSSIWFAGAALLYNREFYGLVKQRLRPRGVLQQWVQLHHMSRRDMVTILASVRAELPFVWVYLIGAQGMIVACDHDCSPTKETIAAIDAAPALRDVIAHFGGSVRSLRDDELLDPPAVDRLIEAFSAKEGIPRAALISTDDDMRLEYATPRGNALPEGASFQANYEMLRAAKRR